MPVIYAAMPDGLFVLRGRRHAWQVERQLEGLQTQCVAIDPLRPEHVYCGTFGQGLWRSDDAGATWHAVGASFAAQQVTAVAVSRAERARTHGVVYVGTEPSALYRSADGGKVWVDLVELRSLPSAPTWSFPPRPSTSHVRAIALDPNTAGWLAVAIEAGALVRSRDGGRTWEDRHPDGPRDSHTLAMPPRTPGRLYAAAGDGMMRPGQGFALSRDGGDNWEWPDTGLRHHYLWGLAVDPGNPETLVVSAAAGAGPAHDSRRAESAIYRRTGGGPWRQIQAGLPADTGTLAAALAANEAEPGVFYAGNNHGLYWSEDAGESWQRIAMPWPERPEAQRVRDLAVGGSERAEDSQ